MLLHQSSTDCPSRGASTSAESQRAVPHFATDTASGVPGFAEPTVTINTREALSAMNHMFSTALPHEHAHVPSAMMAMVGPDPTVTISTADALRAIGMAFDAGAAGTAPHDALAALDLGAASPGAPGLAVYEDTQLIGGGDATLAVYEDTQLIGGDATLAVYEDTQLLNNG